MFPEQFVEEQVDDFTASGDLVFDPFSGRGTTVLQSLLMGREAASVDINPVAFCVSSAKAETPGLARLIRRIDELEDRALTATKRATAAAAALPEFFRAAFSRRTLRDVLFLRASLAWKTSRIDRFLAALLLGILHGEMDKSERYLSNQMPRTISPKPGYSVRYWKKHRLVAPNRDVFQRLREDAALRLRAPPENEGRVALADARHSGSRLRSLRKQVQLVVTSPPYFDVTNFEEDQWLRLWFLGNAPHPTYRQVSKDDRYEVHDEYWRFLSEVWAGMKPLMKNDAVFVCRLGATGMKQREISAGLNASIKKAFPRAEALRKPLRSELGRRQTEMFLPDAEGCRFEVDYVFALNAA